MRSLNRYVPITAALAAAALCAGCPSDDPYCGDLECQIGEGENAVTCPQDCQPVCGDGSCTGSETHASCARDCPVECGDGSCDGNETSQTCPGDCPPPPVCGDGTCDAGENGSNCPSDCPVSTCGNGVCAAGEDEFSCFADCNDHCGGGFPVDCPTDDLCWSTGTNCSSNVFTCNGARRCANTSDAAFCCGGVFVECPAFAPFFCPQDGLCYQGGSVPSYCSVTGCTVVLGDC